MYKTFATIRFADDPCLIFRGYRFIWEDWSYRLFTFPMILLVCSNLLGIELIVFARPCLKLVIWDNFCSIRIFGINLWYFKIETNNMMPKKLEKDEEWTLAWCPITLMMTVIPKSNFWLEVGNKNSQHFKNQIDIYFKKETQVKAWNWNLKIFKVNFKVNASQVRTWNWIFKIFIFSLIWNWKLKIFFKSEFESKLRPS